VLVGRQRELEQIDAVLDEARRGRSGSLAIVGEPGVGKTSLLEQAREQARDLRVLKATGVESESELPFAGLHELLRPLLGLLSCIPAAQARALRAALGVEQGAPDPFAVGVGTLSLLVEAAEEIPVVALLDDVQWLDHASANALLFAARRLRLEQIAVIAALRPGSAPAFDALPRLDLEPLAAEDARRLLRTRQTPVAPADEERVLAAAAGNPLALLELPVELAQDLPTATSSHERLRRTFAQRIDALPTEARLGLLLAAAEPDPATVRRAAVLQHLEDPLTPAESAGLIRISREALDFRHPVVRSLAYANAPAQERTAAHRALAEALSDAGDIDRRAWHLAAAADAPDETVAALLEQTAERAIARGGQAAAARALERSARLSVDPPNRARRLVAAARAQRSGGDAHKARALAEEARPLTDEPALRADIAFLLHVIGQWNGSASDEALLLRELEVEDIDDERRLKLLMLVIGGRMDRWDATGAAALVPQIERYATGAGPDWALRATGKAAGAYLLAGDFTRAAERFQSVAAEPDHATMGGLQLMALEWFDAVRAGVDETIVRARASGNLQNIGWNRTVAAHLELRCGRLDAAEAAVAEASPLREILGEDKIDIAVAALASVHAWRGQADACEENARQVIASARAARDLEVEGFGRHALALLALGAGKPTDAIAELEPIARRWAKSTVRDPLVVAFIPDLIEAYALAGATDDARHLLSRFRPLSEASGNRWMRGACARCAGLLASAHDYDRPFTEAIELLENSPYTLELARAQLAYGERLRRARRTREARTHLRAAFDIFGPAGASPWERRAAAELRAAGVQIGTRPRQQPQLTPQELHIAMLVAEGKSNKQIAAAMYLSPKTIEHHLANTYRKLDIHTRAELTHYIARQIPARTP